MTVFLFGSGDIEMGREPSLSYLQVLQSQKIRGAKTERTGYCKPTSSQDTELMRLFGEHAFGIR